MSLPLIIGTLTGWHLRSGDHVLISDLDDVREVAYGTQLGDGYGQITFTDGSEVTRDLNKTFRLVKGGYPGPIF